MDEVGRAVALIIGRPAPGAAGPAASAV